MFTAIRETLVNWKNHNTYLSLIWHIQMRKKYDRLFKQISDIEFVRKHYEESSGRPLNLENPQLLSEKISWLMLNYRDPLMTQCADKYSVREYVAQSGYASTLNELYAVYDNIDDFDPAKLPEKFVLKATHSSHRNIICLDKKKINWFGKKLLMKSWLKENTYHIGREWCYDGIKPRIICERYLENTDNNLIDYKFYCVNGIPYVIEAMSGRFQKQMTDIFYDCQWKKIDTGNIPSDDMPRPDTLEEMISIAKTLAAPFPQVRVDFYSVNGKIIFGELTFYSGGGKFDPVLGNYEKILGEILKLPTLYDK